MNQGMLKYQHRSSFAGEFIADPPLYGWGPSRELSGSETPGKTYGQSSPTSAGAWPEVWPHSFSEGGSATQAITSNWFLMSPELPYDMDAFTFYKRGFTSLSTAAITQYDFATDPRESAIVVSGLGHGPDQGQIWAGVHAIGPVPIRLKAGEPLWFRYRSESGVASNTFVTFGAVFHRYWPNTGGKMQAVGAPLLIASGGLPFPGATNTKGEWAEIGRAEINATWMIPCIGSRGGNYGGTARGTVDFGVDYGDGTITIVVADLAGRDISSNEQWDSIARAVPVNIPAGCTIHARVQQSVIGVNSAFSQSTGTPNIWAQANLFGD